MSEALVLLDDYPQTSSEEFLEFISGKENQDRTFELIDGQIIGMAGNTTWNHQAVSGFIARKIGNYLEGKTCQVASDINVYLYKEIIGSCKNIFQPDVVVGCDKSKMTDKGYEGTPELVVEVISKSTAKNDYHTKCRTYMEYGVKEYWIVDYIKNRVVVYINSETSYPSVHMYTFSDTVKAGIFEDLSIDFNEAKELLT